MSQAPDRRLSLFERVRWSAALYVGVLGLYYIGGHVARPPLVHLETALDRAIPFVPLATAGYVLVYVVPLSLLVLERTEQGVHRMVRAVLFAYAIATPFFALMPVQDADPPLDPHGALERLLDLIRHADVTKNACPSMHVGLAVLLALIGWRHSRAWGALLWASVLVIAVSTLLVKQHFLVDLPAGATVAWIAFRGVYGRRPQGEVTPAPGGASPAAP